MKPTPDAPKIAPLDPKPVLGKPLPRALSPPPNCVVPLANGGSCGAANAWGLRERIAAAQSTAFVVEVLTALQPQLVTLLASDKSEKGKGKGLRLSAALQLAAARCEGQTVKLPGG